MNDKTKNVLIAFLLGYLIIDFAGVALLYKKSPVCLSMFLGDFKSAGHWAILVVAVVSAVLYFKHLEKKDEQL